jgi:hypothetical protein
VAAPAVPGLDLNAIVATSDSDVWAFGDVPAGASGTGYAEHFDGTSWSTPPSPFGASLEPEKASISSSGDIWVTTYGSTGPTGPTGIVRFHAGVWSAVNDVPTLFSRDAVAALSDTDVWVVGGVFGGKVRQPVAEHWDGSSWAMTSITAGTLGGELISVAALGHSDVWAVGYKGYQRRQGVAFHWNGTAWSKVGGTWNKLYQGQYSDVSAVSGVVRAVGYEQPIAGGSSVAIAAQICGV